MRFASVRHLLRADSGSLPRWAQLVVPIAALAAFDGGSPAAPADGPAVVGHTSPQLLTVAGDTYNPQSSYPLYAGGGGNGLGTLVGHVAVSSEYAAATDVATFTVTYDISDGYCVRETHLGIGLTPGQLGAKNGNPSPKKFPQQGSHVCVDGGDVTYSDITVAMNGQNAVVIAAESVVEVVGSPGVPGANYASGNNLATFVTGRTSS